MNKVEEVKNNEAISTEEIEDLNKKDNIKQEKKDESVQLLNKPVIEEKVEDDKQTHKKDNLHRYTILITLISIVLFIGLIIFSTIFGLINRKREKIVSGVSINGIDVSELSYKEALEKVSKIYYDKVKQNISLVYGDYIVNITPEEIESTFGIKEAVDMGYSIGRSGKLLKDNYAIINTRLTKLNINPSFTYNEKILTERIEDISINLPEAVKQSSYYIEGDNLIITKGKTGLVIKNDDLKTAIIQNIVNLNAELENIEIPVEEKEPDKINIEKIRSEIYKEAKDAYYTKEPFAVYAHVDGVDFNISIEEAKELINTEQEQIVIPLKITKPNVTTNQIGTEAFPDLIASYSTTFAASNYNRSTNIRIASSKVNGVVLMPDEEFSYNQVVGQRTIAAGFKSAPAYSGGKVVNEIGGGICQVSSTLYNTALRANLEIIKRSNHRFATGYVPLSTDATVSWGGPEFIFKNSRKYPIKIVSTVNGGRIKVDIYGCKEEVEYDVVIQSQTLQVIPMKTEYKTNTALPAGTTKTVQKGHPGYKSSAYRILKLNGQIVSKQLLSTDTYAQLSTIIEKN